MPAHQFGDGLAHGKGRGKVTVEDLPRRVLAFFRMARRDDARFAVALFGGGRAAFFDIVQEGGGKENVLRLRVQRLICGQCSQGGSDHFGVRQHVAFAVPFGVLRHARHRGEPVEAGDERVPVGGEAGGVMGELPHVQVLRYW